MYNYANSPIAKTFVKYAICCVTVICTSQAKLLNNSNCVQPIATQRFATILFLDPQVKVLRSPRAEETRERTGIICSTLYLGIESIGHALYIIIPIHI